MRSKKGQSLKEPSHWIGEMVLQISGDEYAGTWEASVASGVYRVTIIASASGASKTFGDVLKIEIIGPGAANRTQQA